MSHSWEEDLEVHINDLIAIHKIDPHEAWTAIAEFASDNANSIMEAHHND